MLDAMVKRDGSIEITPVVGDDEGPPPTARVRLLVRNDKGMVIDRPIGMAFLRHMEKGTRLNALVAEGADRWQFSSTILGAVTYRLNDATEVPAIAITLERNVRSAQRREFFRVTIGNVAVKTVLMTPNNAERKQAATDDVDGIKPFEAKLINIGGGGIGVLTPQRVDWQLPLIRHYDCTLRLPTRNEPLIVPAEVVRLEAQEDGTSYMGLHFTFATPADRRACEDAICPFTAWHQRQILQRRKERE